MSKQWFKNFADLSTTLNRKLALEIANAGLDAIDTQGVVAKCVKLENNILNISGQDFDLSKFKRVKVVGIGKASCNAAAALEKILGGKISIGAIVDLCKIDLPHIESMVATHPRPSLASYEAGKRIYEIVENSTEEDLVIVIVSGGGSALLCYPETEYVQGIKLYDNFLEHKQTISELNTVRKHLSLLKGGGLAKLAYPATVIGLIFSDVPGDHYENVASGPTYKDMTTVAEAQAIVDKNNLGAFSLVETTKEDKYFEKVHNFVLVSNNIAVEAMAEKSKELGLPVTILGTELYDDAGQVVQKIFTTNEANESGGVVLGAGEPSITVTKSGGKGGRTTHMALLALKMGLVGPDFVFLPLASDGMDNSDAAGAIVDQNTLKKAEELHLDINDYIARFDSYNFFQKTRDMLLTGPTEANVSDLMILLTKK